MGKTTTNAAAASFHAGRAAHFAALALRDADTPLTADNAAYMAQLAADSGIRICPAAEAVAELSFMDEVVTVAALPAKAKDTAKPALKPSAKKGSKPEANGQEASSRKKEGLRKPQIAIMAILKKMKPGTSIDAKTLSEKSGVHIGSIANCCGYVSQESSDASFARTGIVSLQTLGLVKVKKVEIDGAKMSTEFELTAAGRKHSGQ